MNKDSIEENKAIQDGLERQRDRQAMREGPQAAMQLRRDSRNIEAVWAKDR